MRSVGALASCGTAAATTAMARASVAFMGMRNHRNSNSGTNSGGIATRNAMNAKTAPLLTSRRAFAIGCRTTPRGLFQGSSSTQGSSNDSGVSGDDGIASYSFLDIGLDDDDTNTTAAAAAATAAAVSADQASVDDTAAAPFHQTEGEGKDEEGEGGGTPPAAPPVRLVAVKLHNLPKNWMHEEIIEFVHTAGQHAGIPVPHSSGGGSKGSNNGENEDEEDEHHGGGGGGAIPKASSPYVHRLSIPFGRRTGLVYGNPRIILTSPALAQYLVKDLTFEPDDYRSRISFTLEFPSSSGGDGSGSGGNVDDASSSTTSSASGGVVVGITSYEEVEEGVGQEQAEALRTLELDRYLMAPDILLDIAKMHQRRLVASNEKVLLDSFLDGNDDDDESGGSNNDDGDGDGDGDDDDDRGGKRKPMARQKKPAAMKRKKVRRAGSLRDAGRGSMHNTPIPKPYVQGRSL